MLTDHSAIGRIPPGTRALRVVRPCGLRDAAHRPARLGSLLALHAMRTVIVAFLKKRKLLPANRQGQIVN
jgi:hypothetical protein